MTVSKYMRAARRHSGYKPVREPRNPVKQETAAERAANVERELAMPVSWLLRKQAI